MSKEIAVASDVLSPRDDVVQDIVDYLREHDELAENEAVAKMDIHIDAEDVTTIELIEIVEIPNNGS